MHRWVTGLGLCAALLAPVGAPSPALGQEMEGELKDLTWVGFQQLQDASRVFVRTSDKVQYRVDASREKMIVLILENTRGTDDIRFVSNRLDLALSEPFALVSYTHESAEEVIHILSGRGISGLGETEVEMAQGDTMFVPRGEVHWFYNPFDAPVEMIFVYTKPSLKSAGYRIVE